MKKLVILLLAISVLICLASCEYFISQTEQTTEQPEHEHTFEYVQYEKTHFKQYTCGCPSPDIAEEHYDNDGDKICDVCEYSISCPYKWVGNSEGHYKMMLCNCCDAPDVIYPHEIKDFDAHCDICGYFSPFTDRGLVLADYQTWLADLNVNNVEKIVVNHSGSNVWAGVLCSKKETNNKELIAKLIVEYQNVKLYNINVGLEITDELYHIEFILTDGIKKDLYFDGGAFIGHYMASDFPTLEEYTDIKTIYMFNPYQSKGYVYESNFLETPISNFAEWNLESIELEAYEGAIVDVEPTHCIKFSYWEIYVVDNTLFYVRIDYLEEVLYYRLTNADFYALINKYPINE